MKRSLIFALLAVLSLAWSCDKYKEQYHWEKYQQQLIKPVSGVSVSPKTLTLRKGASETLTATVTPQAAANKEVNWFVDNPTIASVDTKLGKVTGLSAGETIVTVETVEGRFQAECFVTVISDESVAVTGVQMSQAELALETGATHTLTAYVKPSNASNQSVSWSSNDDNVATVSNGLVTAVAVGSATITVTTDEGGFQDVCVVTVSEPEPKPGPSTGDYYVTVSGAGDKDGSSWQNAKSCVDLVALLADPVALNGKTILMAGGNYDVAVSSGTSLKVGYDSETKASFFGGYNAKTGSRNSVVPTVFTGNKERGIFSIAKNTKFTFDGVEFAHALVPQSAAEECHGAFFIDSKSTEISFNDCFFHDNTLQNNASWKGGAAIYLKAGKVKLNNCLFKNNKATGNGGAIRTAHKDGVLMANNCKFIANKIERDYGTSLFAKGNVAFHKCLFYGGTADNTTNGAPELNVNWNYIFANCTVVQRSVISSGMGTIRSETITNPPSSRPDDAGYVGWFMNNVIYNTSTEDKAWGVLFSTKIDGTEYPSGVVSKGYNAFVGKNGGISHANRFTKADTDQDKNALSEIGPISYSFNESDNTLNWTGSFNFTRATDSQVYEALGTYQSESGITTLGTDFRTWLREIGAL